MAFNDVEENNNIRQVWKFCFEVIPHLPQFILQAKVPSNEIQLLFLSRSLVKSLVPIPTQSTI
jgi:hypothetical protein